MATPTRGPGVEEEEGAATARLRSAAAAPTARSTSRPRKDASHPPRSASSAGGARSGSSSGRSLFALVLLIPFDLEPNQHRLAAILALVVVWWVSEAIPIPVTALLGVALVALLEATPTPPEGDAATDVVFATFSDDTIFLFIGSFIIAEAMVVHGLHRRLAFRVLSMKAVGGSTYRIILAFGLIGALTSPVMSNTAGAAMMLPIALGRDGRRRRDGRKPARGRAPGREAEVRRRAHARDHLRHHGRRPPAPDRQPAEPDRPRPARERDRRADHVPRVVR